MLLSGYFRVFRLRFGYFIQRINENYFKNIGFKRLMVEKFFDEKIRQDIVEKFVNKGLFVVFLEGVGYRMLLRLFGFLMMFLKVYFDGRVIVDLKRIFCFFLIFYFKVGLVVIYIGSDEKRFEKFDFFKDVVLEFRKEEV